MTSPAGGSGRQRLSSWISASICHHCAHAGCQRPANPQAAFPPTPREAVPSLEGSLRPQNACLSVRVSLSLSSRLHQRLSLFLHTGELGHIRYVPSPRFQAAEAPVWTLLPPAPDYDFGETPRSKTCLGRGEERMSTSSPCPGAKPKGVTRPLPPARASQVPQGSSRYCAWSWMESGHRTQAISTKDGQRTTREGPQSTATDQRSTIPPANTLTA